MHGASYAVTPTSKELGLPVPDLGTSIFICGPVLECSFIAMRIIKTHLQAAADSTYAIKGFGNLLQHTSVASVDDKVDWASMYIEYGGPINEVATYPKSFTGYLWCTDNAIDVTPMDLPNMAGVASIPVCDAAGRTTSQKRLDDTDWEVVKELERIYLSGHPISTNRDALRAYVDEELKNAVPPSFKVT